MDRTLNVGADTVSVIVPTYNRARYIGECIDSLLAQTTRPLEIVVVDDGSVDNTPELLALYGDAIRVIRKNNGGKPDAVNLAASQARGHWLWILDDDDVALPRAIETRLAALAGHRDAAFVYGPHFLGQDGPDGHIAPGRCNRPVPPRPELLFLTLMKSCFFHLGTALFTKSAFVELRGLDPGLLTGEDYDFQIRLAARYQGTYCDEPVFVFRQHGGVRGPSSTPYAASERATVFRRFSQAIGLQIRATYGLGDYLVPRTGDCDVQLRRHALIQRANVMANHGCIAELVEDLRLALSTGDGRALTTSDLHEIEQIMRQGWAYEASCKNFGDFLVQTHLLSKLPHGRRAVLTLAKGVFRLAVGYPASLNERLVRLQTAAAIARSVWL